jgi:hypothetical protein
MGWKAHVLSAVVSLVPAFIQHLRSGRALESEWPVLAGATIATLLVMEAAIFLYRRVASAPHEV